MTRVRLTNVSQAGDSTANCSDRETLTNRERERDRERERERERAGERSRQTVSFTLRRVRLSNVSQAGDSTADCSDSPNDISASRFSSLSLAVARRGK
jgi:hypothetical protein